MSLIAQEGLRLEIVAQSTAPGSPSSSFPGKRSRQSSQFGNLVSEVGKFKQYLTSRDPSSQICFMFNKQ